MDKYKDSCNSTHSGAQNSTQNCKSKACNQAKKNQAQNKSDCQEKY